MYRKIVVPLDGSELAECVLPHLETIAKGCGVQEVIFVRVAEPVRVPTAEFTFGADEWKRIEEEKIAVAATYLNGVVGRVKYDGVSIQSEVLSGRAAEIIADYAAKKAADLIVIATHGRSGISRWAWGSVADRILRSSCVPVLMVRAPGCVPGV
jgi:nucleotide-binding universal stress UspA family protein